MAEITIPRWLMTNRCMPAGRRYGKRPIWVDSEPKPFIQKPWGDRDVDTKPTWSQKLWTTVGFGPPREPREIMSPHTPSAYYPPEIRGLFEGWEYRFWAADVQNPMAIVAECRVCKALFSNEQNEDRKLHLGKMGCSKQLCAAYRLLLKDMVCVICNQRTTKEKWGVPLCSSACMEAWCTVESQPDALTAALALVRDTVI